MKKRLLVLAMVGIMSASVLTACGGKETATTTAVETTVAAAETTTAAAAETTTAAADAAAAEEDKAITNYDEYLTWTNTEWSAADDEEKLNAAIAYSVYTTEAMSGQAFDDETKALTVEQMRAAETIMNVVNELDTTLPSFADKSLKDFADTAVEQVNSLLEEQTEAAK